MGLFAFTNLEIVAFGYDYLNRSKNNSVALLNTA